MLIACATEDSGLGLSQTRPAEVCPLLFVLQLLGTSHVVIHANRLLLPIRTTEPTFDAFIMNADRAGGQLSPQTIAQFRNHFFENQIEPHLDQTIPYIAERIIIIFYYFYPDCHAHPQKPSHVIYYTGFIPRFSSWGLCLKLPLQGTPDSTPYNETASGDNMQIFCSPLSTEFWQCRSAGLAQAPAIHHYQPQPMQSHLGRTLLHRLPAN